MERLLQWIKDREQVRLAKEAGSHPPWTDNEVIQQYRFCNVRRMDDKVSVWLWENWYRPHVSHPNMLKVVALARFINLPESLGVITHHVFTHQGQPRWKEIKIILRDLKKKGVVFNSAYMVRGNDGQDKIESVIDYYCSPLTEDMIDTSSMEETHIRLLKAYGLGSFMAGQVVADLRWAVTGKWSDKMEWAPIGPGSRRGMNRLHGRDIKSPMKQSEFNTLLCRLIQECEDNLPEFITERLEAHDYQNCLCEFDKSERTMFDNRRPKKNYPGTGA